MGTVAVPAEDPGKGQKTMEWVDQKLKFVTNHKKSFLALPFIMAAVFYVLTLATGPYGHRLRAILTLGQ